jgi:hypothetical protein
MRSYLVETRLTGIVHEANGGRAGAVRRQSVPIDLLLTDRDGPNGRELADQLHQRQSGLRSCSTGLIAGCDRDHGWMPALLLQPVTQALPAAKIREILDKS